MIQHHMTQLRPLQPRLASTVGIALFAGCFPGLPDASEETTETGPVLPTDPGSLTTSELGTSASPDTKGNAGSGSSTDPVSTSSTMGVDGSTLMGDSVASTSAPSSGADASSTGSTSGDDGASFIVAETTTPDDTTNGISFANDIYPQIIMKSCGCHIEGMPGGLAMPDASTAYANLVEVTANQAPMDRVSTNNSGSSYLWHKVNNTHSEVGGSGGTMPLGDWLDPGLIDLIANWIDAGTLP